MATSIPSIGFDACKVLRVQFEQQHYTIDEMDGETFYRLCQSLLSGNNARGWEGVSETLNTQKCDEYTKWSVVMDLLRFHAVTVENGVMAEKVKPPKKKKAEKVA